MVTTAKAQRPKGIVDTTGWLTRNQAVDLLGVAMTSLYRWEREGLLHVQHATRGDCRLVAVYDPNELARVPRRHRTPILNAAGELTARVFEMLDEGKSIREIVIAARETTDKVTSLKEEWLDTGGADLVIGKNAKAEIERHVGPFQTVGELAQKIASALGMPITGTPTGEVIERGRRETIEAIVPDDASDEQVEHAIVAALDAQRVTP